MNSGNRHQAHARVIVATYNQPRFLPLVLTGYLRQSSNDFTLVLADDGSRSDVKGIVDRFSGLFAEEGVLLEHVWHEDRGWRKNAVMNEAVRRGHGEPLLIFSDADCIPNARFVETHCAAHGPRTFHVAGSIDLGEDLSRRLTEAHVMAGDFEIAGTPEEQRGLRKKRRQSTWGTLLHRKNRPKIIGRNMAMDRTLFEEVNGFDEQFQSPYFGEDSDVRDRLMRLRPRPRVKNLYTQNEVFHLYHDKPHTDRNEYRAYYDQKRPVRCIKGLEDLSPHAP